jgi:predicted nucleic acid-binding protein
MAFFSRYEDLSVDFADATLVVLAEQLGADSVLTTDHRGFEIYRVEGRRRIPILPT